MATLAASYPLPAPRSASRSAALYAKEIKYEFLKLWRTKAFSLSVIGFPVMFYFLFGVSNKGVHEGGVAMAKYMLGSYCCFGMIGAALFAIGAGLSGEKAAGWLELKRASPMPPMAYLLAKCVTAQFFGVIIVAILMVIGVTLGGVHLGGREIAEVFGMAFVGTIPFAALGLLVALVAPANAATGFVNLIYLPMSFMGGLWVPLQYMPKWLQAIAPAMPTYHLNQLMLSVFGYQAQGSVASHHWAGLAGFTLLCLGVAWAMFHRAEQNS